MKLFAAFKSSCPSRLIRRRTTWFCANALPTIRHVLLTGLAVALLIRATTPAQAEPPVFDFRIPREPLNAGLADLGLQSGVSIGRASGVLCKQTKVGLVGRFTIREALSRILKSSDCTFLMVDAKTAAIVHRIATPPRPPPQGSTPEPATIDLVVTATRRAEPIDRSPYDVTRVAQTELQDERIFDAADLAPFVPGMTVTNLGAGRDKILLRGLSDGVFTGRTQSTVSLYLDDVLLTYNAPDPDLRLLDIQAVEVLQGPQGTLYGAGSIGGVVHIITNKPDLSRYAAALDVSGSATEGGAAGSVVEGVFNVPLVQDHLAFRIAAYSERDGGYIDNVVLGRGNVNDTTRTGARAELLWSIDQRWSVTLGGVYQSLNDADTQYATAGLGAYQRASLVQEPHDNDFNEVSLVIEGSGAGWAFKSSSARVRHQIDSQYDASLALDDFAPGAIGAAPFDENDRKDIFTQEVTLASSGRSPLKWLLGAFALDDEEQSQSDLTTLSALAAAPPLYAEDRSDHVNEYAAYGEATYMPLPRLSVTAGLRLFQSQVVTRSTIATTSSLRTVDARVSNRGVAPKVVVRYDLAGGAMIYAQATEGYRGGGVNTSGLPTQAFGAPPLGQEPYQRYGGDELWNYEIGSRLGLFGDRLRLRSSAFYDNWRNIQSDQLLPSGLPFTANVGDGYNKGVEIELIYQATPHLSVRTDAVFNDPELTSRNSAYPASEDARLPGIARATFGGDVKYEQRLGPAVRGFADIEASYVGRSTVSFNAATSATMGDYWNSRINAGVEWRSWRAALFITNPLGETGDTFSYGDPFSLGHVGQTTPLRPRTVGLSFGAIF